MMTSTMKILLLLPLGILLLTAAVYYFLNNLGYADNTERNAVESQIIPRRRRATTPTTMHYCKFTQYYDQEEGRCLGVPGGGKVLHIENRRSCGINVLKPHCKSSQYYHICKRDKSILAQCANRQIFDNRLQRCVYYDSSQLTPNVILPDSYMYYDHVGVPNCTRSGRFPVIGHCSMFYTCDTNGHRFYQSVFKCPQNTGYQVDRGVCNIVSDCRNDNSVDTVCVPDAPGENVESLSLDEAAGRNMKEIPEIFEGSKDGADDSLVKREKDVNSMIDKDIVATTPVSTTDTLLDNNNDNDGNMDVSSDKAGLSKSVNEALAPDGIDRKIMHSEVPNLPETMQEASNEEQDDENESSSLSGLQITSLSTTELDDALHFITTSTTSIKPEYANADVDSEITDTAPRLFSLGYIAKLKGRIIQDITTKLYKNIKDTAKNFIPAIDTTSNDAPKFPAISDVSFKPNEETQGITIEQYRNNEASAVTPSNFRTDSVDPYSPSPISDILDTSNTSPPISDKSSNIDEKMQNAPAEQYKNEDSIVNPTNFNTDSIDMSLTPTVSESSQISDESSNIDEKMQDAPAEQYKNNEDSTVNPTHFNTDSIDMSLTPTVSTVSESSQISDESPNIDEKMQDAPAEQYKNNEDSTVNPTNFNTDSIDMFSTPIVSTVSESSPISDESPNVDEKIQDAPAEQYKNNEDSTVNPTNFNTDSVDMFSTSTVSTVSESSPISDESPNIDEKMQDAPAEQYKNNEESTVNPTNFNTYSVDMSSTSTVSTVSESSPISDESLNIDEKMQDAPAEQYKNNEESTVNPTNFNTYSVDMFSTSTVSTVSESSPISDESPNVDEKMQDTPAEQYKNNEDSTVNSTNFNADSVDMFSTSTISTVSESSPISDESSNIDEKMQDAPAEQYKNNEDSTVNPTNFNTDSVDMSSTSTVSTVSESSPISDESPNIDEKMQDVPAEQYKNEDSTVNPTNFNTDSVDMSSTPIVSTVSESSPISDESPNIDEKMQDVPAEQYKNEDSTVNPTNFNTDSVDMSSTPIVSTVSESSPISDESPNIDEKMQDAPAEQYKNNEDSTVNPTNFNTDSVDMFSTSTVSTVSESSPINDVSNIDEEKQDRELYKNNGNNTSDFNTDLVDPYSTRNNISDSSPFDDTSPKLDEEIRNVTTEMYREDEGTIIFPNSSTEVVDPNLTSAVKDIPANTSSPIIDDFDVLSSTSTPAILPLQGAVDQFTTERSLETIPSIDSKLADVNLSTPVGDENVPTRDSSENTDDLYPTSTSTLISKEITTSMDVPTTIQPSIQNPSISDTDLVTQNDKEASIFFNE